MFVYSRFFNTSQVSIEHFYGNPGFYRYDLGHISQRYEEWEKAFPRIRPYYAMKANPNKRIIETLVKLGAGVDCASGKEIKLARECGAKDIIFANPCKTPHDIKTNLDIERVTVDSESELLKMAILNPTCKILLRIRADDATARHQLGTKFGADMMDVPYLLSLAQELKLNVTGIAFHVGSASNDPGAYARAIQNSKYIRDIFPKFNMTFEMLDIGGGFCGKTSLSEHVVSTINWAITMYFPENTVTIIAEPGRYFTESTGTLYVQVIGYKDVGKSVVYYLADGVYGSFNPLLTRGDEYKITTFDVVRPPTNIFMNPLVEMDETKLLSTVFGPTCDAADCLMKDVMLPRLSIGDYLAFPMMGGYGVCGASGFNGYDATAFPVCYRE